VKKTVQALVACAALLVLPAAHAAPIVLTPSGGGSDSVSVDNVTLGGSISFEYMFSNVVYTGGAWIGLNASVIPPVGDFPIGQYNTSRSANTGWISATIDTTGFETLLKSIVFTGNTFGAQGNSATITIRNIAVDGQVIAGQVPEPATLTLLGLGLLGMGLVRRRRPT